MNVMTQAIWLGLLAVGVLTVGWIGLGFVGSNGVALLMTLLIGLVFGLGAWEVWRFRAQTQALHQALQRLPNPLADLSTWLQGLPLALQAGVGARIANGRTHLPGLALTPYLVGLLVMLGMLGTFLGMVVTFKGAVFALEGSTDLQAIRSALAEPIKGLGLSFGTSVAGVATSALLGMMSALCRRERAAAVRELDARMATDFKPYTQAHQRSEAYAALQVQARLLPDVMGQLQAIVQQMDARNQKLSEDMMARQAAFHTDVSVAYTALAQSVTRALQDSLSSSARQAGEQLQPLLEQAVARMSADARSQYTELQALSATQLQAVSGHLSAATEAFSAHLRAASDGVSASWSQALDKQSQAQEAWVSQLDRALGQFTTGFDERAQAWLASTAETHRLAQQAQQVAEEARQAAWSQAMDAWQRSQQTMGETQAEHALALQQAICERLGQTADALLEKMDENAMQRTFELNKLLQSAQEELRQRVETEARRASEHEARMSELAAAWHMGLVSLREDERARSQAALDSLQAVQADMQAQLGQHLATLGAALEAPMSRLMKTAAEVPQAASALLAELRSEMTRLTERDNLAFDERRDLMGQMASLLQALNQVAGEQRAAVDALVSGATEALALATGRFDEQLSSQAHQAGAVAIHVQASAVELASLGEAFQQGVAQFSVTNEKLVDGLQRVEAALKQSTARSDEQMAYYVAQAREVIDLSLASQQGIMDDLMRLRAAPLALESEVPA